MDRALTSLAARQHGVVARWQLVERGWSAAVLHGLDRRGRMERLARGVYAVSGAPPTPMREAMVAALRGGRDARVVGERLLAAAGVPGAARSGGMVVLVPPGRRLVNVDVAWRSDPWTGAWAGAGTPTWIDGVPSYDLARNLVEAAAGGGDDEHVRQLADGLRSTSRRRMASVERIAGLAPTHPGAARLALLGCLDVDAAESSPERVLEIVLTPFRPERQVPVLPDVRVDFLIRAWSVAVEYDGSRHEAGHARSSDQLRDARVLEECGIRTVRIDKTELRDPPRVLARVVGAASTGG